MAWHYIDGNDLLLIYETMQDAIGHVRSGEGPVLVEAETYRYFGHSKSDRNLYRTKEEIDEWRKIDPIDRFRERLEGAGVLTEEGVEKIALDAQKVVDEAVEFAESSPEPDVETLTEFVYA
jgi:pyruvate dehydrogenase E1 component alpha subunit